MKGLPIWTFRTQGGHEERTQLTQPYRCNFERALVSPSALLLQERRGAAARQVSAGRAKEKICCSLTSA